MAKEWFGIDEFECPCCGEQNMNEGVVKMLNMARTLAGVAFVVKAPEGSACRCFAHNRKVGGKDHSAHLIENEDGSRRESYAVDIKCTTSHERFRILYGLINAGFTRIGVAKTFIHADTDPDLPPEVVWVY